MFGIVGVDGDRVFWQHKINQPDESIARGSGALGNARSPVASVTNADLSAEECDTPDARDISHRGPHPQWRNGHVCLEATLWQLERIPFGCVRHLTASQLNSPESSIDIEFDTD